MAVTLSIIALGFAIFRVIAQYFPIFEEQHVEAATGETLRQEQRR